MTLQEKKEEVGVGWKGGEEEEEEEKDNTEKEGKKNPEN